MVLRPADVGRPEYWTGDMAPVRHFQKPMKQHKSFSMNVFGITVIAGQSFWEEKSGKTVQYGMLVEMHQNRNFYAC